jgi:hypothetical protein
MAVARVSLERSAGLGMVEPVVTIDVEFLHTDDRLAAPPG